MAIKENEDLVTYEASADLSSNQFFFVSIDSNGQVATTGNGSRAVGVLQNKPSAQGRAATVATDGKVRVQAGGSVTNGNVVASDGNGKVVDAASGDWILGEATQAGSTDEVITIDLQVNTGKAPV